MEILELGKTPISEDNPSGEDVRYDPENEKLEEEIAKLSSPSYSGGVDWDEIAKVSASILETKSKNLLVACYLCVALMKKQELSGLADGVHIIRDMLDNFWESMYPPKKRLRGRLNAVKWWQDRITAAVPKLKPVTWPEDNKNSFEDDLKRIDDFLSEKSEDAPMLRGLIGNLSSLVAAEQKKPEVEPEKEETKEAAGKPEGTKPSPASPPPEPSGQIEVSSDEDTEKLLKEILDRLGNVSSLLLKKGQFNIIPYRFNRISAWINIKTIPPSSDGKTMIPPPDEQIKNILKSQYQSNNWNDLLSASESRVRQFLFWFDLSRLSAESLENLGQPALGEAVAIETAMFIKRLPGIEKLAFSDGTPFADEDTKDWLKSAVPQKGGSSISGDSGEQIWMLVSKQISDALALIKENKTAEALNSCRTKIDQASSLRESFIWEICLCRVLLKAKKPKLIVSYFSRLLNTVSNYNIEEWEPQLAIEALTVILSGLRQQEEKSRDEELIDTVLNRITVLSPAVAFDLI